jgi:hypothetical protein
MAVPVESGGISESKKDDEIDLIAQRVISELQTASSKDLVDKGYARKILRASDINLISEIPRKGGSGQSETEVDIERRAVVKALLLSTWLQRLYFIIRSAIMSLIGAGITFSFVIYYGSLNLVVALLAGAVGFVAALVFTRLLDGQIDKVTQVIVKRLARHQTLRNLIMNHL